VVEGVERKRKTYSLVLDLLSLAPLEGSAVALVLETLRGDQPLDLGSLGVGLLALALGLDLAADDVLADLVVVICISFSEGKCVLFGFVDRFLVAFPSPRSIHARLIVPAERTTGEAEGGYTRSTLSLSTQSHGPSRR
jgi:hypothetical protein